MTKVTVIILVFVVLAICYEYRQHHGNRHNNDNKKGKE